MKIALRALLGVAGLFVVCATTPASAVPITDSVNPTDTLLSFDASPSCPSGFTCATGALTFLHDITDSGFNPGQDILTSATITIHLTDQAVTGPNNETYRYDIAIGSQTITCAAGNCVPNPGLTETITLNAASLADLADDGKIDVTVTSTSGSFSFADSLLTAQVTEFGTPNVFLPARINVPEPATLLLLGAGLIGLGLRFRRRS